MKILFTSDWHMDVATAGVERFDEIAEAVEDAVDRALDPAEGIGIFWFLGDLADPDNRRAWRATSFAIEQARRLEAGGVRSYWLTGNHDVVEDGHRTSTLSPLAAAGFDVIESPRLVVHLSTSGTPFAQTIALPYTARDCNYNPEEAIHSARPKLLPRVPVFVVGHLNIDRAQLGGESFDMARGRDLVFPSKALRNENVDVVLALNGHYHRRQTVIAEGSLDVHIPGSLARLTRGEAENAPGYLVVEVPL